MIKEKNKINKINSAIYADYFLIDNPTYGKFGPGIYYFSKNDTYQRADILKKKIEVKLNKISVTDNNEMILIENNDEPNNLSLVTSGVVCKNFKDELNNYLLIKSNFNVDLYKNVQISKNNNQLNETKCSYINFKINLIIKFTRKK